MKKAFFGLIAVAFISLSSFTSVNSSEDLLKAHNCTYRMYNAAGQYLGNWTLYDVPDNVSCGSAVATQAAIDSYNGMH